MPKTVKTFRGLVRGDWKVLHRVANALIGWHSRQDTKRLPGDKVLEDSEVATIVAAYDLAASKLAQTMTK